MKRNLSILLVVLMFFTLSTINVKAITITNGLFNTPISYETDDDFEEDEEDLEDDETECHVAKIGETTYETLKGAFEAAANDSTITLIGDVSIDNNDYIVLKDNKNLTLDLNNFDITANNGPSGVAVIEIQNGSLTINGSNYSVFNSENYQYALHVKGGGTLTINGGHYKGSAGGLIHKSGSSGKINISDGIFECAAYNGISYVINQQDSDKYNCAYIITGGTFKNVDPSNCNNENSALNYLPNGYRVISKINDSATWYTVVPEGGYVKVNDKEYTTLEEAYNVANNGDTITILGDLDIKEADGQGAYIDRLDIEKDITIDLNGKTLTGKLNVRGGKLVVKDSTSTSNPTIDGTTVSYSAGKVTNEENAVSVVLGGTFILEGGIIETTSTDGWAAINVSGNDSLGETSTKESENSVANINGGYVKGNDYGIEIYGKGATLNVNGGAISANIAICNTEQEEEYNNAGTSINVKGGTILASGSTTINCAIYQPTDGTLNISGGNIYSSNGVAILLRSGQANISGGSITATGSSSGTVGGSENDVYSYAVMVDALSKYQDYEDMSLTITDGEFTSELIPPVKYVSGSVAVVAEEDEKETLLNSIEISGGTYSEYIDANYLKDGYISRKNSDGKYVVKELSKAIDTTSSIESNVKDIKTVSTSASDSLLEDVINKTNKSEEVSKSTKVELVLKVDESNNTSEQSKILSSLSNNQKVGKYLDLTLNLVIDSNTTNITDTGASGVDVTISIPDEIKNSDSSIERNYYIIRNHNEKVEEITSKYNSSDETITFNTSKFSTYAIVYKDTKKETGSTNGGNGKRTEANTPCEEWNHSKNWTWSESQGKCVYRVTNTSSK